MNLLSKRTGAGILLAFALLLAGATFFVPRIPQSISYHNFADQRAWLGIPNFGDVASNCLFAVAGIWGLLWLAKRESVLQFTDLRERWAYVLVFVGLLLTAFGSSYYHLAPDNARLVWDRLPMTIAFMGLVAALLGERINVALGVRLLPVLILAAMGSVIWWWHTENAGAGDLRNYAAVQIYAVMVLPLLLLLPPRYTRSGDIGVIFALYVIAKIFETEDRLIFRWTDYKVSGHTLKHIAAGAAGLWILRMLEKRKPVFPGAGNLNAVAGAESGN